MLKIKDAIDTIIGNNAFLEDALFNSYLNISSFSEFIKPQVELLTKKEVTVASIKMTLSRISIQGKKKKEYKLQADTFFLRKNITIMTIEKDPENHAFIHKIYENVEKFPSEYIAVIEWGGEIDIVFSKGLSNIIRTIIPDEKIKIQIIDVSLIGASLNKEAIHNPWLFYTLSKKLFFFDINILQVISTYREIGIIVKSEDTKRAFEILVN